MMMNHVWHVRITLTLLTMNDAFGDGWNGATFSMSSEETTVSASLYQEGSSLHRVLMYS